MRTKNQLSNKYIASVRKALPSYCQNKRSYIGDLSASVRSYCTEQPDTDMEQLLLTFGSPTEIAEAFLQEQSGEALVQQKKLARIRQLLLLSALLLLVVIGIAWFGTAFRNRSSSALQGFSLVPEILGSNEIHNRAYHYDESIKLHNTTELDLGDRPLSFPTAILESIGTIPYRLTKIHATKSLSCLDRDGSVRWTAEITTDFTTPSVFSPHELIELVMMEPEISIEVMDSTCTVDVKDIVYTAELTQVTLLIQSSGISEEKLLTFFCDKDGNLK